MRSTHQGLFFVKNPAFAPAVAKVYGGHGKASDFAKSYDGQDGGQALENKDVLKAISNSYSHPIFFRNAGKRGSIIGNI